MRVSCVDLAGAWAACPRENSRRPREDPEASRSVSLPTENRAVLGASGPCWGPCPLLSSAFTGTAGLPTTPDAGRVRLGQQGQRRPVLCLRAWVRSWDKAVLRPQLREGSLSCACR